MENTSTFLKIKEILKNVEEENRLNYIFNMTNPLENKKENQNNNFNNNLYVNNNSYLKFLLECADGEKKLFKNAPSALAHAYLGIVYELGVFGTKKDYKKAYDYYLTATKQSNALGTFRLAQFYEKGLWKPKNYKKAVTFYRCAAKLGLIEALHTYGSILFYGDLCSQKDVSSGLFYLKLAVKKATKEYPYPYYDLGKAYESNNKLSDIPSDDKYAFYLYEKGAELGCPNSQYRIARAYEFAELGKLKNMKDALYWYKLSASNGQIDAQLALSTFYFTGLNNLLEVNYSNAYMWALKSAAKGHSAAAYCVGEYIENGIGVKKDLVHALWWYSISNVLGNIRAKSKVEHIKRIIANRSIPRNKKKCNIF